MQRICFATIAAALFANLTVALIAADKVDKGKEVFTAQKCSLCHSVAGKGNAKGPLDGVGSKLSADEIKTWIVTPADMATKMKSTRKPPMKAYGSLPKDDLEGLVAYLQTLKK